MQKSSIKQNIFMFLLLFGLISKISMNLSFCNKKLYVVLLLNQFSLNIYSIQYFLSSDTNNLFFTSNEAYDLFEIKQSTKIIDLLIVIRKHNEIIVA